MNPELTHDELVALLLRLATLGDTIYVRELVDGRWQSVALTELDPQQRAKWSARFLEQCFGPFDEADTPEPLASRKAPGAER